MAFKTKSTAERIPIEYEGATIFAHHLLFEEQGKLFHACTVRGETDGFKLQLLVAQAATDGWDEGVHDADDHPLPVPAGATDEERRQRIALVVSTFPNTLITRISEMALADNAEAVKKNWSSSSSGNFASPSDGLDERLPATIADASGARTGSPSPVTRAD